MGDTSLLAAESLTHVPLVAEMWSPVHGTLYLQDSTDRIFVNVGLEATDVFQGISSDASVCVYLSRIVNANAAFIDYGGSIPGSGDMDSLNSTKREALPLVGNRPECKSYGNGALELPAYAVLDMPPGMYEVQFILSDIFFGFEVSCTSTFYVRAKDILQRTVLGAPKHLERHSAPTGSSGTFKAKALPASLRSRKPIAVLALKYGTHGDDARASVCVDGKVVFDVPLAQLFRTETLEVQRELAREQGQRLDLRESHEGKWALKPRDEEALSSHLALQAATGFADGCKGVRSTRRLLNL